jgi:hypothetical protein
MKSATRRGWLLTPEDISPSLNPYGFMSYELPSMFTMQDQF